MTKEIPSKSCKECNPNFLQTDNAAAQTHSNTAPPYENSNSMSIRKLSITKPVKQLQAKEVPSTHNKYACTQKKHGFDKFRTNHGNQKTKNNQEDSPELLKLTKESINVISIWRAAAFF